MRRLPLAFAGALLLAACAQEPVEDPVEALEMIEPASVIISDQLPGLEAAPAGIGFWTHPNVAFNGLMIVASQNGLVSYDIENGEEISRIADINARALGVSYFGQGRLAKGAAAIYDADAEQFAIYAIDNLNRLFDLSGDPIPVRGNVRGACFGRAQGADTPTLFVVQNGEIVVFNLEMTVLGASVSSQTVIATPDDISFCAVDLDGRIFAGSEDGRIFRVDGEDAFDEPFAEVPVVTLGGLSIVASAPAPNAETRPSTSGYIFALDNANGRVSLVDRETGALAGVFVITANDELPGVDNAVSFGVSGANLGGLYRNGFVGIGVAPADESESAGVRIAPMNGIYNALDLAIGAPENPRGDEPETDGLDLDFSPALSSGN
ncbi:MAG: phytase [Pseudomonadota bacterium]